MALKVSKLINGLQRMTTINVAYYDADVIITTAIGVAGTGYDSTHTIITLPSSQAYTQGIGQLQIFMNGILMTLDQYSETSTTTITLVEAAPQYARITFRIESL